MFDRADRGATSAEYALIVTLIAGVIIVSATAFSNNVSALFEPMVQFFQNHP